MKIKMVMDGVAFDFEGTLAEWQSVRGDFGAITTGKRSPRVKTQPVGASVNNGRVSKTKRNAKSRACCEKGAGPSVSAKPVVQVPIKAEKTAPKKVYALGLSGAEFPPLGGQKMPKGVFGPITREQAALRSAKNARRRDRRRAGDRAGDENSQSKVAVSEANKGKKQTDICELSLSVEGMQLS